MPSLVPVASVPVDRVEEDVSSSVGMVVSVENSVVGVGVPLFAERGDAVSALSAPVSEGEDSLSREGEGEREHSADLVGEVVQVLSVDAPTPTPAASDEPCGTKALRYRHSM
ncbi:hypothetical protein KIPB_012992 [Kipferlia bialata]|uniref:Uncharacterized protein n=1 Tax=Kipferlia bialata TaxID=797122 RepID=A0A391NU04_9EUKA|nr:hypothetical protein KIPB_012992 [Kipferlia bialata]|eukprot:g12992.t1